MLFARMQQQDECQALLASAFRFSISPRNGTVARCRTWGEDAPRIPRSDSDTRPYGSGRDTSRGDTASRASCRAAPFTQPYRDASRKHAL